MMKIRLIALSAFAALIVLSLVVCGPTAQCKSPFQPKLENASVSPDSGIWSDTFTYTVNCTSLASVNNITLEVFDLSLGRWKEPEKNSTRTYTSMPLQRQNLTWSDITPFHSKCNGTSSYRFKYEGVVVKHRNGTEMIYYGPEVREKEFKDATVYPTSGRWDDPFDYSVYVNLSWVSNITLDVFDIGNGTWKTGGTRAYKNKSKWERLTWPTEKLFSNNSAGEANYRFVDEVRKHESDSYSGPLLNEFKDATVYPTSGRWDDPFEYSVYVNLSWVSNITLNVFDIGNGTWKPGGTRAYTNKSKWERLTWSTEKLFSNNSAGEANYQFVDEVRKHKSDIYPGPLLTINEFKDATVYPTSGCWDDPFVYSVSVNLSWNSNITLNVFDIGNGTWNNNGGTRAYTTKNKWERLTWSTEKLFSRNSTGMAEYRFVDEVRKNKSDIYHGPLLTIGNEFKNATVTPRPGYYNDSYTCSVWLNASSKKPNLNITLEVRDITNYTPNEGYKWKLVKTKPYKNTGKCQRLDFSWDASDKIFAKNCAGVANLRFYYTNDEVKHESDLFDGPMLKWYNEIKTVYVSRRGGGGGGGGILSLLRSLHRDENMRKELASLLRKYILPEAHKPSKPPILISHGVTSESSSWHDSFDYYIEVEHPSGVEMWLTLEVYSPGKNKNLRIGTREIKPWMYDEATNRTKVEWRDIKVFTKEDVKVDDFPKYSIRYNDGKKESIWGPYSGPELTNSPPVLTISTVSPEEGRYEMPFEYKVNVTDEDGDDVHVTLYIRDPEGKEIYNETHPIKGIEAKRGKIESWIYNEFTEKASNKTFKYYFNATDGIDFIVTEKYNGPYIKFVPPVKLIMPYEPYPNSSNWRDEFTYKARIYNPTTEEVIVSLEVYIPSEGEWKKKYDETIEPTDETDLIWFVRPFSVKDFDKVGKYRFTVKGGPLTYEKEEEFYGPKIEDVLIPIL